MDKRDEEKRRCLRRWGRESRSCKENHEPRSGIMEVKKKKRGFRKAQATEASAQKDKI